MESPSSNKRSIENVVAAIAYAGNRQALDTIERLFESRDDGGRWITMTLLSQFDSPHANYVRLWYYAPDSRNPLIRDVAVKTLAPMVGDDPIERRQRVWAEAALERYHHPPTEIELLSDPLFKILWDKNPVSANEVQKKISKFAAEASRGFGTE